MGEWISDLLTLVPHGQGIFVAGEGCSVPDLVCSLNISCYGVPPQGGFVNFGACPKVETFCLQFLKGLRNSFFNNVCYNL